MTGNRLMDMEQLQLIISEAAVCRYCGDSLQLQEDFARRKSCASYLLLKCVNIDCVGPCHGNYTSKTCGKAGKEINKLSVLAMRAIGRGRRGAATLASHLNLPPPVHKNSWQTHTKAWGDAAHDVLQEDFSR